MNSAPDLPTNCCKLNNNMRCFEIEDADKWLATEELLNNNMRCFEITLSKFYLINGLVKQ